MRKLTHFARPTLVDAKKISAFPSTTLVKTADGKPATDDVGNVTGEQKTSLIRLKFHLGRLILQHPAGPITTIRHTIRQGTDEHGQPHTYHQVTWRNSFGFERTFHHPEVLGEFLVLKYGIRLTTEILKALSALEQEQ